MGRERLTSRARQAADDKTPYPGSINQEGREEEQRGSMTYRTFEPSIANHELTDYTRVHGVSDQHNDIGFGIPDPASGMLVASSEYQAKCIKAAELAETFLGPKVSDRMLLAQARDFLSLDDEVLDRTIERFNRTDSLYVAAEDEDAEEDVEEENEEGESESEEEEAAEALAKPEEGEGEVEEEASEEEAVAQEAAIPAAPAAPAQSARVGETEPAIKNIEETPAAPAVAPATTSKVEEQTSNPVRDIPEMPEGQAASPQVNVPGSTGVMGANDAATQPEAVVEDVACMSAARATNLAQLAACTLEVQDCTQANIIKQAKKFASLNNDQVKILLASYGKVAEEVAEVEEVEEAPEAPEAEMAAVPCATEETETEVEVASVQDMDLSSFDLNEEFNDGPVTATAEDQAELASIFDEEAQMMMPPVMDPTQAIVASIAQLSGQPRAKVASKIGVQSVGKVTLQAPASQPANDVGELESLWS